MKTPEQEIRTLREKARSWLASLAYHSAQGRANFDIFSQRLQFLFKPVLKADILHEAVNEAIPEGIEAKEAANIKKRMMSRLTPDKMHKRMLYYHTIYSSKAIVKNKPDSLTLGRLLITWAVLTDQSPQDFITRLSSNVIQLYKEWRDTTGCLGLSDEECYSHPKESARFWSGIWRTLIRATTEDKLIHFMHTGIEAIRAVARVPGLEKEIYTLLDQASRFITEDAARKIELALKASPHARQRISIPELKALVLREEGKLGWSKNTENEAFKTLKSGLSPELREAIDDNDEVIRSSMESVSRRGLFNNLSDALNGRLKPGFVESITHFLKSTVRVESYWEFDTSGLTQENIGSIRRWLFRR